MSEGTVYNKDSVQGRMAVERLELEGGSFLLEGLDDGDWGVVEVDGQPEVVLYPSAMKKFTLDNI